jgi:hypothetical protein
VTMTAPSCRPRSTPKPRSATRGVFWSSGTRCTGRTVNRG